MQVHIRYVLTFIYVYNPLFYIYIYIYAVYIHYVCITVKNAFIRTIKSAL